MTMGRLLLAGFSAALLTACGSTFESDYAALRAEIQGLEREMPADEPLWITEGPNRFEPHIEDYTLGVPGFIHLHVARSLLKMKSSEIAELVKGVLPVQDALRDPASVRGRFWKATGTIGNLEPLPVNDAALGVKTIYAGALFMDGRPVLFHVMEKSDVVTLGQDVVEVDGIFVKVLSYTTDDGRLVEAPFLMGRRVGRYF
jgi:hypothetical protein